MTDDAADLQQSIDGLARTIQRAIEDEALPSEGNTLRGPAAVPWPAPASGPPTLPDELAGLYRACDGFSLSDVHVGYFLHPIARVLSGPMRGEPTRIGSAEEIITFGSDGGGGLFAMRCSDGAVLHFPTGRIVDGCYVAAQAARVVSKGIRAFIERVRDDVEAFSEAREGWTYIV